MALPAIQTREGLPPVQTVTGLPPSPVLLDPLFGTYPSEQRAGLFTPTIGTLWVTSPILSYMRRYQASLMSRVAQVPVTPEVHSWTPEEARAQTEKAIAKIATVNPELAEELVARMGGLEHADQGLWDNLKDLVGDIVSPALSIGGKLLDILTRPARIVPELLADKGDDPWYRDVMQALSGSVDTTWDDVLEEWGMEGGPLRAALGFVLDVATDPLTYVTFGTAGIGRAVAARAAARTVAAKVGAEGLEELVGRGAFRLAAGQTVEEAALQLYDDLTRVARPFATKGGVIDEEVAAFLAGQGVKQEAHAVVREMLEAADVVHRMVGITGLRNMPAELALSTGRKLTRSEVLGVLEQGRRAALFSRALYPEAKAAAGAVGGLRFRFALPFTDLRYVSPAVPISLDTPFGPMRRFLAGTSAGKAILSEMERGLATWDDFLAWVNGGLEGLAKKNPALFQRLRGRGFNLGSIFYSAAETVGRYTAHLSPHAKLLRGGGLMVDLAAHANVLAKGWREQLLHEFWTWRSPDGQVVIEPEEFLRRVERLNPARRDDYIKFIETVPSRAELDDLDEWWYQTRIRPLEEAREREALAKLEEGGEPGAAFDLTEDDYSFLEGDPDLEAYLDLGDEDDRFTKAIEAAQKELENLKRLIASFSDEERETLLMLKDRMEYFHDLAVREGVVMGDVVRNFRSAIALTPDDARRWLRNVRDDIRDVEFYLHLTDPDVLRVTQETGVGPLAMTHTGDLQMGRGIYLENRPREVSVAAEDEIRRWGPGFDIERLPDGRFRVRGWHGTHTGGIDWERSATESGLHIGTQQAARDRLEAVGQRFRLEFFDKDDPDLVLSTEEVIGREALDNRIRDLFHQGFEDDIDYRIVTIDTDVDELPKDVYRLIPVQAEGKFLDISASGASDGLANSLLDKTRGVHVAQFKDLVNTAKENKLISPEEADELLRRVSEHRGASIFAEDLRNWGYQGIIYRNSVEDRGSLSLAILDMSTVRSVERVYSVRAAARVRNPLVIDRRPPEMRPNRTLLGDASSVRDDAYAAAKEALEKELKAAQKEAELFQAEGVFEKAGLEPLTDERAAKLDEMFTEWAKKQGYDSVLVHEADGTVRLLVFDPKQVKLIDEQAPAVLPLRGYYPRVLTREAREFLSGQLPPEELKHVIYGEPRIVHTLHRVFIEDPIDVAEQKVRDLLRRKGYDIPDDLPIYERDVVRVVDSYSKRLTEGILHETMGFNARRMAALADYAPGLLGGPVPRPYWTWTPTTLANEEEVLEALELPKDVRKAMDRIEKAARSVVRLQTRIAELNDRTIADIRSAMEFELYQAGSGPAVRIQAALKRLTAEERSLGRKFEKRIREALEEAADARRQMRYMQNLRRELMEELGKVRAKKATYVEAEKPVPKYLAEREASLQRRIQTTDEKLLELEQAEKEAKGRVALNRKLLAYRRFEPQGIELAEGLGLSKTVEALEAARGRLAELSSEYVQRGLEKEAELVSRLEAAMSRLSEAQNEFNHIVAAHRARLAGVLPAFVEHRPGLTGFVQLQVKGLEGYAMPAYIALEFQQVLDTKGVTWLRREWKRFMAFWKEWATIRWPGFHLRNEMGAWFNNVISGVVDVDDYRFAHKLRVALHNKGLVGEVIPEDVYRRYHLDKVWRDRRPTYDEVAARISDMGIGRANARATADVRTMSEDTVRALRRRGRLVEALRDLDRQKKFPFTRAFGERWTDLTENIHRVAGFLGGLKATRGDWLGARAFVMMRQGDYLDLTRAEEFIRDLVPFYKWFRTNFPFQLRMLIEDPAKLTALKKVADASFAAAGIDPQEFRARMPEWMRQQFIVPLPLGKSEDALRLMMLDLPAADLYTDAREFLSMFLPTIRPLVEAYVAEKNLFTGRPLEGEMVPLAGYLDVPILRDLLAAMPFAQRGADGRVYLPDKLQHVMTMFPVFSRFKDWLFADPKRVKYRAAAILSAATGVRIFPFSDDDITNAELEFYYNEVLPVTESMRSMGIQLPRVDDLSPWTFKQLGFEVPESVQEKAA